MKNKNLIFSSAIAALAMLSAFAAPLSAAALGAGLTAAASLSVSDTAAKTAADAAINGRILALTVLETRVNAMYYVSSSDKASLSSSIQGDINEMTTLKATIDADTDPATLKTDIQSITKSYRIYILVLPQGRITTAGDRAMGVAAMLNSLSSKLQVRIAAAQAAGNNVTALNNSLADLNAKTADANTQAQAAINEVSGLQPDNGNSAVYQSNKTALQDARSKIRAAIADLVTARVDAGSIVTGLAAMHVSG